MFSLHESTQRRVCRVAFVVCAVLPTLATLSFVAYVHRPWREADWQRTLSQRLHVRVAVDEVASPQPGVKRLHNVRLADLRSERPLGSLNEIRAQWRGSQLTLTADELRIEAGQLPILAAAIATWIAIDSLPVAELQADRLTVVDAGQRSVTFKNVRLHGEANGARTGRLAVQAELSRIEQGTIPLSLRLLVEQRDGATVAVLDTGGARVPAWLLLDLLPSLSRCVDATFAGSLRLEGDSQNLCGTLRGQFDNVALNQWIGPGTSHRVQGTASVTLDQLQWRAGRVEKVVGNLRAERGAVSLSLLADVVKRLFFLPGAQLGNLELGVGDELQTFDELACSFQLTDAGITIGGECPLGGDGAPGCVLAVGGRPLLVESRYPNLPVAQLVQVLSQPAASWLPASQEAHDMAGKLPLPSSRPKAEPEVAAQPERNANSSNRHIRDGSDSHRQ
jgi:hypothetical protein